MAEEDEEKTAFITPCGTYCFVQMPFGLKNAGSTFARVVHVAFEPQIHRNVEAYMDDIVVKSKDKATLIQDLEETFANLPGSTSSSTPRSVCLESLPASFSGSLCLSGELKPTLTRSRPSSRLKHRSASRMCEGLPVAWLLSAGLSLSLLSAPCHFSKY